MPRKSAITLRDILAHIQGLRGEMNDRFDGVENRLTNVEYRLDRVEQRLTRVENGLDALNTSHRQLQINVLGHVDRIKTVERHCGLVRR